VKHNIESVRNEYRRSNQSFEPIYAEPFSHFNQWMEEALNSEEKEPTAMTLSTIGNDGFPQARIVLLKQFNSEGFVFFTNYASEKGKSIENNSSVALLMFWPQLERQVRITGIAVKTDHKTSDEYFSSRPKESNIGAWASNQSKEIPSRTFLEDQYRTVEKKFRDQSPPRPPFWGGYRVIPHKIEFWQGRTNRLHDRILYVKSAEGWKTTRLAP
jgi:pyridoxamine 5'-phosphate oxidase